MEHVDFRKAHDQQSEAADFLKRHVKGPVLTKGSQIEVDGISHKEAKLMLHKFLRHSGLDGYRILSESGTLVVVPPHLLEPARHEASTSPPPASATMPYFFPGTPGPVPTERKFRKRKD